MARLRMDGRLPANGGRTGEFWNKRLQSNYQAAIPKFRRLAQCRALSALKEGETIKIHGVMYKLVGGNFVDVSGLRKTL
jgi:hypothetical protein